MKIAFLYIAEAYQCYHGAAIALELAKRGAEIVNFYNDPDTPYHLERIHRAYDAPAIPVERLARSPLTRGLQAIKPLGMQKDLVLWDNRKALSRFDMIFAVENSIASLRKMGVTRPKLVYASHGSGDRARGFIPRIAAFDLVLLSGRKTEKRMLEGGLIRPGHYALPGYTKLETAARIYKAEGRLFPNPRPTVLYNPHKAPELQSWSRFIEPMLRQFAEQDRFNLIVAPHVKMFRRRSATLRRSWESRSTDTILIDLGSDRSVDMTYTEAADIYVGDISSQVYEFLARPRPCIFLNAHGIDWQNDPSFLHWRFGEVVDRPEDLMPAIERARERHPFYAAFQAQMATETLGDLRPGIAGRAADAVIQFWRDGRV
ncbi:hypothetical protein [Allosphingosinicella vermicomposti]|uniref:hypothetical protein n=1 Tax=Allosphingosinicella vermicomposti TaxID=614671 RepID=UPI000D1024B2|nr:hypothetical protein [Allosphingosinicella vermicomposti]